jgi:hypothetical protein
MPVTSERAPRIADGRIVWVLGYTLRTDQSPEHRLQLDVDLLGRMCCQPVAGL